MTKIRCRGDIIIQTPAKIRLALLTGSAGLLLAGCSPSTTSGTGSGIGGGSGTPPPGHRATYPMFQPGSSYITVTQIIDTGDMNSPMFWAIDQSHWLPATSVMFSPLQLPLYDSSTTPTSYAKTYPSSTATTSCTSVAGVYADTDHTTCNMAIYLQPGTGTSQNNPDGSFEGASETDIGINAQWILGSLGFPHGQTEPTYEFPVHVIPSGGGFDRIIINLTYTDIHAETDRKTGKVITYTTSSNPLYINQKFTPASPTDYNTTPGTVPFYVQCYPGDTFTITGRITLKAFGKSTSANSLPKQ
jgi:hypothetical protein